MHHESEGGLDWVNGEEANSSDLWSDVQSDHRGDCFWFRLSESVPEIIEDICTRAFDAICERLL